MRKVIGAAACFLLFFAMGQVRIEGAEEMRAVWVTTVLNLDWPSRPGLSPAEMMAEADVILDRAAEIGLNAIMLQVRPTGDAIYRSSIFPWSEYITGTQGLAPADGFDPLQYWIDGAHSRGMELHAWINPYRVTHGTANITDVNRLYANNPARLNPTWVRPHGRALYYDPGLPQVRSLIIDGIIELITNYNVDGIHFDDYFYPGRDFNDANTFAAFGGGWDNIHDWRREQVNLLVQGVQEAIREHRPEVRFGISPFAIWQNSSTTPLGSNTNGMESYHQLYSDSRRWVLEGWIDYIVPQIYWHMGHDRADFATVLHWWLDVVYGTDVNLYVGMAVYREERNWNNWYTGEILRQLRYSSYFNGVAGHMFFRVMYLMGHVGDQVQYFYRSLSAQTGEGWPYGDFYHGNVYNPAEPERPFIVSDRITIVQPSRDITIAGATGYFFFGTADPSLPLYVSGWPVYEENRTPEGFFMIFNPLFPGDNVFIFTQEGQTPVTRTITVIPPGPAPTPAPPVIVNPTPPGHPYYAVVGDSAIWAFPGHTTAGATDWMLLPGQKDRIIAHTSGGNWIRLSSGAWVQAAGVTTRREPQLIENVFHSGRYNILSDEIHTLTWSATAFPVVFAQFNSGVLTLYFGMHTEVPYLNLGNIDETIFQSVNSGIDELGRPFYAFTIRPGVRLEGYWTGGSAESFTLYMRLRRSLGPLAPLDGFTIIIDPGHGGSDPGALGALGGVLAEKEIVLNVGLMLADNLRALGAEVIMTRDGDFNLTVQQRREISRNVKPHMFISIHANSTAETTNATNIRGFTMWYRNELSRPMAQTFLQMLHYINPYTNRHNGLNNANFYVCRPSWAPHGLVELSFMNNVHDYAWMLNPRNQAIMADGITDAVLEYFR